MERVGFFNVRVSITFSIYLCGSQIGQRYTPSPNLVTVGTIKGLSANDGAVSILPLFLTPCIEIGHFSKAGSPKGNFAKVGLFFYVLDYTLGRFSLKPGTIGRRKFYSRVISVLFKIKYPLGGRAVNLNHTLLPSMT